MAVAASASGFAAGTDGRHLVEMPPEALATMRAEMLDNQSALHLILGALAEGKFAEAGDIAEIEMGLSTM